MSFSSRLSKEQPKQNKVTLFLEKKFYNHTFTTHKLNQSTLKRTGLMYALKTSYYSWAHQQLANGSPGHTSNPLRVDSQWITYRKNTIVSH